jgi:uncharacterized membrane protein (GlpM family)
MGDILARFVIGGLVVSLFSVLADTLRPKSFAGLLGAAPSVALATLGLTIRNNGKTYAAFEARSMVLGALAFLVYAFLVSWLLRRYRPSAMTAALGAMPVWFVVSLGLWFWIGNPK